MLIVFVPLVPSKRVKNAIFGPSLNFPGHGTSSTLPKRRFAPPNANGWAILRSLGATYFFALEGSFLHILYFLSKLHMCPIELIDISKTENSTHPRPPGVCTYVMYVILPLISFHFLKLVLHYCDFFFIFELE